ncbi:MAG: TlpA disulfide reductase family protein [Acidobacteriota bacterium]
MLVPVAFTLAFVACAPSDEAPKPEGANTPSQAEAEAQQPLSGEAVDLARLEGSWRGVLDSPGGELPFSLGFASAAETDASNSQSSSEAPSLWATVGNGEERIEVQAHRDEEGSLVLAFPSYDSEITARASRTEDGAAAELSGIWRKTGAAGQQTRLPFRAERGEGVRFQAPSAAPLEPAPVSLDGSWSVVFTDEDGTEPALGEFQQEGDRLVGTFLTPTGDYRYLVGDYLGGRLRLSTFDGAHAFLFSAEASVEDGEPRLTGDFWSRDTYHATWEARPTREGEEILPDPWTEVRLQQDALTFQFPVATGQDLEIDSPYRYPDARHQGKVVLVNIFGSWCPNCNDEAPLLARWHREYADQGLEIVGLAYEHSGDLERDRTMVQRFAERHGIEYPLLVAGISDKSAAGETLPALSSVKAYPTSIFVGRDGEVQRIHSGFAGPGTGEHHQRLVAELEEQLLDLLAQPAAGGAP